MPLTVAPWRSYVLNDDEEETSFVLIYYDHVQGDFFNNEKAYLYTFSTILLIRNIRQTSDYQILFHFPGQKTKLFIQEMLGMSEYANGQNGEANKSSIELLRSMNITIGVRRFTFKF